MQPVDMSNFRGRRKAGVDYSRALRDWLPELISEKPMSKREIAQATGRNFETVTRLFQKLDGQIHIAGWRSGSVGEPTALWLLGPGENAPRPAPMTTAEKSRRYRETENGRATNKAAAKAWRKSPNGLAYRRRYYHRKIRSDSAKAKQAYKAMAEIDPLMAAIMGARK